MIESLVSATIAVITGGAILTSRTHARITEMEKRIDAFELRVAEDYLSKKRLRRYIIKTRTADGKNG
jgi:hypothetical protein